MSFGLRLTKSIGTRHADKCVIAYRYSRSARRESRRLDGARTDKEYLSETQESRKKS